MWKVVTEGLYNIVDENGETIGYSPYRSVVDRLVAVHNETVTALRLRLLSAAGDDLCRLSQEEIRAYTNGSVQIPPKEEFIASCVRFHEQIASEAGVMPKCLTLAQLIAENEQLRRELKEAP